jgi:hypothetical protein
MRFHSILMVLYFSGCDPKTVEPGDELISVRHESYKGFTSQPLERSVNTFDLTLAECEKREFDITKLDECFASVHRVNVAGIGWLILNRAGKHSNVFPTDNPNYVVKLSTTRSLCRDEAALRYIGESRGYELDPNSPGIPGYCMQSTRVMKPLKGDMTWAELYAQGRSSFKETYMRLARLLQALENLQELKLSHNDLNADNIRVNSKDPKEVFIVNFESATVSDDPRPRADGDLGRLCGKVPFLHQERDEFLDSFCAAIRFDPDFSFNLWISLFEQLAQPEPRLSPELLQEYREAREWSAEWLLRVTDHDSEWEESVPLILNFQRLLSDGVGYRRRQEMRRLIGVCADELIEAAGKEGTPEAVKAVERQLDEIIDRTIPLMDAVFIIANSKLRY